jgi:hypothetical protein
MPRTVRAQSLLLTPDDVTLCNHADVIAHANLPNRFFLLDAAAEFQHS